MISLVIPSWNLARSTNLKHSLKVADTHIPYKMGAVEGMALGAELCKGDILAFLHDDVEIHNQHWAEEVEKFFGSDSKIGMIGFGGALGLGTNDIYKRPYDLHQLARLDFMSNLTNAEEHGRREPQPQRVAVLDGFAQIIRKSAYEEVGGWRKVLEMGITFHMYDAAMACMLAEKGWQVWYLPISCSHNGGLTSTSAAYDTWLRNKGVRGDQEVHEKAHRIIYKQFKHILPLRSSL